jgi:hypothetical protein
MAREPSYPNDTPVGGKPAPAPSPSSPASAPEPGPDQAAAGKVGDGGRRKHLVAGAAIGIGSAAIVAALLYANRGRRTDPN